MERSSKIIRESELSHYFPLLFFFILFYTLFGEGGGMYPCNLYAVLFRYNAYSDIFLPIWGSLS